MATAKDTWTAQIKARGGMVTRWPSNRAPSSNSGQLAAKFPAVPKVGDLITYELAPVAVRIADGANTLGDNVAIAEGKAATVATDALEATGLDKGVVGFLAKTLGIPTPVIILLAIVLAYATLAGAGLAPKVKLFK